MHCWMHCLLAALINRRHDMYPRRSVHAVVLLDNGYKEGSSFNQAEVVCVIGPKREFETIFPLPGWYIHHLLWETLPALYLRYVLVTNSRYMNVCLCVFVRLSLTKSYFSRAPKASVSQPRFASVQQISVVKYFSVVLQPPTVKLRGKSEPDIQKAEKKKNQNISLTAFGTNVAVIAFRLFPFVIFCFLSPSSLFWSFQTRG